MNSKESESTLLAIIIQDGSGALATAEECGITQECFADHNCQDLWEQIKNLDAKGKEIESMEIMTTYQAKSTQGGGVG